MDFTRPISYVVAAAALFCLASCKSETPRNDAPKRLPAAGDPAPGGACDAAKLESGLRTVFPAPAVAAACDLPGPMRRSLDVFFRPLPSSSEPLPRVEAMIETGWPIFSQACDGDLETTSKALCVFGRGDSCSDPEPERVAAFRKRCRLPDSDLFTARESTLLTLPRELIATALYRWLKTDGGVAPARARHTARALVGMIAECAVAAPSEACARALQSRVLYLDKGNVRGSRATRLPLSRSDFHLIERATVTVSKQVGRVDGHEVAEVACATTGGSPCNDRTLEQAGNRFTIAPEGLEALRKELAAVAAKRRAEAETRFRGLLHARVDAALPYGLVADVVEVADRAGFPKVRFAVVSQDEWLDHPVRELPVYQRRIRPRSAGGPSPRLVVLIHREGFRLEIASSHRAKAVDLVGTIPLGSDGYRFYELYNRLRAIQKALYGGGDVPFHHLVTLAAPPDVPWQTVVHTIDAIRSPLEADRYEDARSYAAAPLHAGHTAMGFQVTLAVTE